MVYSFLELARQAEGATEEVHLVPFLSFFVFFLSDLSFFLECMKKDTQTSGFVVQFSTIQMC